MYKITRKTKAADTAARWKYQYETAVETPGDPASTSDPKAKYQRLVTLGLNPDPDDVDEIIGNPSWTEVDPCDECGVELDILIGIGAGCESVALCKSCLNLAVELCEKSTLDAPGDT